MKSFRLLLAGSLIIALFSSFSNQPGRWIQGKVSSFSESFPLEGVTVQVKGTKNFSGTMPDGQFTIEVQPEDKVLVFSLDGYQTEELAIKPNQKDYDIALKAQ